MSTKRPIITVKNISKKYTLGSSETYLSLSDRVNSSIKSLLRTKGKKEKSFWSLKNISFSVNRGEVVGIIGRNGAGKSTLLKILSRITPPTHGSAQLHGRVASMLEVGTGFHPELTGRENIYLNGAILGMTRSEIKAKFNEIVEFSELEDFLDTPVKFYSSGMYTKLAFAVAAHLEPEILLVDEVLSVGDISFQKKSAGKIKEVSGSGRTILFVSHNLTAIEDLCERTILLDKGKMIESGDTSSVIKKYRELNRTTVSTNLANRKKREGSGEIIFTSINMEGIGTQRNVLKSGQDVKITFNYKVKKLKQLPNKLIIQFSIIDHKSATICYCSNRITNEAIGKNSKNEASCIIKKLPLNRGTYTINCYIGTTHKKMDYIVDAANFTIASGDFYSTGKLPESSHSSTLLDYSWI